MRRITWKYGRPVNEEVIQDVEAKIGVAFPSDYRAIAKQHNGGRPYPNAVEVPHKGEVVMERLLRVDPCGDYDVASATATLNTQGLRGFVPFAIDPFGNLFCFQFEGKVLLGVVYWEHESGAITAVCKTFSDMLALLRPPRR